MVSGEIWVKMREGGEDVGELVAEGVRARYPGAGQAALAGVSCRIRPGEFVGLIGPNGAGKSTLLRVLSRSLRPEAGEVRLGGQPLWRLAPEQAARQVAVVAQELTADMDFTAEEVVALGRYPHLGRWRAPGPADRAAVAAAMAATDTARLARRPFSRLSGGERQRVAVARALAQETPVLLLDEPANHLDLHHQIEVFDLIARLNQERGLTVVAVLHDLNLAALYCQRLLLLVDGRLAAAGTPEQVLEAEQLRAAYGGQVVVGRHPVTGTPQVALLPAYAARPAEGARPVRRAGL